MEPQEDEIVDIPENRVKFFGGPGKMLLPSPATVEALIDRIPEQQLTTTDLLRQQLTHQFNVQGTCPVTTRKALQTISNEGVIVISSSSSNNSSTRNEVRQPLVGVGVIILRDRRILLGKRRGSHGAGDWSPPGGHLNFGETPEECAIREVREETGLTVENVRLAGVTNDIFLSEQKHFVTLFMTADCPVGTPELLEPDKCESWGWYDWTTLPEPLFLPLRNLLQQQFDPFSASN